MTVYIDPQTDVTVDLPTDVVSPPDGGVLRQVVSYQEYNDLPDGAYVETLEFNLYTAAALGDGDLDAIRATLQDQAAQRGYYSLNFLAWETALLDVVVPTYFDIGDPANGGFHVEVPSQLCIPFTNLCLPLGGTTLASAYRYKIWCSSAIWNYYPALAPAAVRGWVWIAVIGMVAAVVLLVKLTIEVIGCSGVLNGSFNWFKPVAPPPPSQGGSVPAIPPGSTPGRQPLPVNPTTPVLPGGKILPNGSTQPGIQPQYPPGTQVQSATNQLLWVAAGGALAAGAGLVLLATGSRSQGGS